MKVIDCHCFLIDKNLDEMGVKQSGDPAKMSFRPESVEGLREIKGHDEEMEPNECLVYFKSGTTVVVDIGYRELRNRVFGDGKDH